MYLRLFKTLKIYVNIIFTTNVSILIYVILNTKLN